MLMHWFTTLFPFSQNARPPHLLGIEPFNGLPNQLWREAISSANNVQKVFDFLGFDCCGCSNATSGMRVSDTSLSRRDNKRQRLVEPRADKQRIAKYLARWLGWAIPLSFASHTALSSNCATYINNLDGSACGCYTDDGGQSLAGIYNISTGNLETALPNHVQFCADTSDTACTEGLPSNLTPGETLYVKNITASANDYFKCTFSSGTGLSISTGYTPSTPNAAPTTSSISADDVTQSDAGLSSYSFTVTYSDTDDGIDVSTIDTSDVTVDNGATISDATESTGTATYTITPPGGSWDDGDNGTYTISLVADQVCDTNASPACVAANATLGSFDVTMDTTAPTQTVSIDSISNDSGIAGDFVTNDNDGLTITATLSGALATGDQLEYSSDNGSNWTDITTSVTDTAILHTDSSLTSTTTIQMRVTDSTGNSGPAASQAITIDTVLSQHCEVRSGTFVVWGRGSDDSSSPPLGVNAIVGAAFCNANNCSGRVIDTDYSFFFTRDNLALGDISFDDSHHVAMSPGTSQYPFFFVTISGGNHACAFKISSAEEAVVASFPLSLQGITLSETTSTVSESGSTDTFTVVLDSEPTGDVVLSVVSGDTDETTVSPSSLTFTTSNWDTAQTVTVTGVDDDTLDGSQDTDITISVVDDSSADEYDSVANEIVTVTTQDTAGVLVSTPSAATENGGTGDYTLALSAAPSSGNVVINITPDAQCTIAPSSVMLTDTTPATVTVTATDDSAVEGDHTCHIQHAIDDSSSASEYPSSMNVDDASVALVDDDPGVIIRHSGNSTNVVEGGATDTFEVVLSTQPTADVNVELTPDQQLDLGSGVRLTFGTANWDTPQTVTVTANDDAAVEGTHTGVITLSNNSSDSNYNSADFVIDGDNATTITQLTVSITDNDNPPPADNLPTANNVQITGDLIVGSVLSGSYSYDDADGDVQSGTTLQWLRATDAQGNGAIIISGADTADYTLTHADIGQFIVFSVTPKNARATGTTVAEITPTAVSDNNSVPSASDLTISGVLVEGNTLTASYVYNDAEGDLEAGTTMQWYRADDRNHSNETLITGASTLQYTLTAADVGQYLFFSVTPQNANGTGINTGVWTQTTVANANNDTPPVASDVKITGDSMVGSELRGSYTYTDAENDVESGTTLQWSRADDIQGNGIVSVVSKTIDTNTTTDTYTYKLTGADVGKFIFFTVTPKNDNNTGIPIGAITPTAIASNNTANIVVRGTSDGQYTVDIDSGDTSPREHDGTDFGTTAINRTFTIHNTGASDLVLADNAITKTGAGADAFSITQVDANAATIAPHNSVTFSIAFTPATGISTATISIASNDSDENPYSFNIQGGTAATPMAPRLEKFHSFLSTDSDEEPRTSFLNTETMKLRFDLVDSDADATHYSYQWASPSNTTLDKLLVNLATPTLADGTVTTDAIALTGLAVGDYVINLIITDTQFGADYKTDIQQVISIIETAPADVNTIIDSDGDGIVDAEDNQPAQANSIPARLDNVSGYESKVKLGHRIVLGTTAKAAKQAGLKVTPAELEQYGHNGTVVANISISGKTLNHIFDYEIEGIAAPTDANNGNTAVIILPLETPLLANSSFHKYNADNGWRDFTETDDGKNKVEWANWDNDVQGVCPAPDSADYRNDTDRTGKTCLRLTLQDGGVNDQDGIADGNIVDPFGISTPTAAPVSSGGGGGGGVPYYTITLKTEGDGTVSEDSIRLARGNKATFEATPADGAQFLHWTGDCEAQTEANVSLTVVKSMTCTAVFGEMKTEEMTDTGAGTVAQALTMAADGSPLPHTNAQFIDQSNLSTNTMQKDGILDLNLDILPSSTHQNQAADILLVALWITSDGASYFVMREQGFWKIWDEKIQNLVPEQQVEQLPEKLTLSIHQGSLPLLGQFTVWAGYRLADGTIVYNGLEPIQVNVIH